jgi:multicomponent Na+:H+ antiporter subunit G
MIEIVGQVLLVIGAAFGLVGSLGVLRMPDVYNRIHAQTICVVGGAIVALAGACLIEGFSSYTLKALVIAAFLFVTNPVGSHAIARAAHRSGVKLWRGSVADKLEGKRK